LHFAFHGELADLVVGFFPFGEGGFLLGDLGIALVEGFFEA
jgi:hypothetical protein